MTDLGLATCGDREFKPERDRPVQVTSENPRSRARLSWLWATVAHAALVGIAVAVVLWLGDASSFAQALSRWDTVWYVKIATHGYPATVAPAWAYFPLYPVAMSVVDVLDRAPLLSGLLIAFLGTAGFAYCLQRLAALEFGPEGAAWAPWLVLMSPFGSFFAFAYTEGLFFALGAGSLLCARRGRFGWAGILAALATATRPTGLILVPALLVEAWMQSGWSWDGLAPTLAWLGTVPLVGYMMVLATTVRTGDPLAMLTAEGRFFHVHFAWPWQGFAYTWQLAFGRVAYHGVYVPSDIAYWHGAFRPEVAAGLMGLLVVGLAVWKLRPTYAVFMAAAWFLMVSLDFWRSIGRYELAFFPLAFLAIAATRRTPWLRWVLVVLGAISMAYGASVFGRGMWLA
ncbi:MAG: mannosyltransferase family protein [Candidatus Dormibacteria bacterium]